jgi:predicted small secreted protein
MQQVSVMVRPRRAREDPLTADSPDTRADETPPSMEPDSMTTKTHNVHLRTRMEALRHLMLAALIAGAAALAACSTTEGFGRDVKSLGGGIEDSAARNK